MELYLPNFDVNEAESIITEIHVGEGDHVSCGDVLISVENTKMTRDLLAEEDGYIKLFCEEFEEKKVGDLLAVIFPQKRNMKDIKKERAGAKELSRLKPRARSRQR